MSEEEPTMEAEKVEAAEASEPIPPAEEPELPLEPTAPPLEDHVECAPPPPPQESPLQAPPPPPSQDSVVFNATTYPYTRVHMPDVVIEPRPPTIFGRIPERCVTFCIDTSGSMFHCLDVVKDHLMETLTSMATRDDQPMFNLIEFNSNVTQWADKLVQCTAETVAVARRWVQNLSAKTGTNTQDALLTALADPSCQAVYLATDGLPDQYPEDVLDRVVGVCGTRRVHCIYVTGQMADEATTEFLEDLAVETFGSFHIVTLTTHGCVDKITPIYRSDHSHDKIVYTVNDTIRPNIKTCSVATRLLVDPEEVLPPAPPTRPFVHSVYPYYSTLPVQYYYPHYWSRYRPAKSWLRAQDKLGDPLAGVSPAAGSLLVGKKVIARRIEDGYFYKATVQSQNLHEKFLVAFGPCKHGKYRQTEYQDTFVFDIVDYHDALRHTIITGDRVLAPWEPEGERFAPGIVIAGQEKRQSEGPEDQDLTISFSNGRTEKIPRGIAAWIPPDVYERLSLELQMPKEARQNLLSTADQYPIESLPGYPSTRVAADPVEYPRVDPFIVESSPHLWDPYLYRYPPYLPAYHGVPPFVISRKERVESHQGGGSPATTTEEESSAVVIPGTDMTQQELDQKVMSQLMEHRLTMKDLSKLKAEVKDSEQASVSSSTSSHKLLGRREKQVINGLKKSVSFSETEDEVREDEVVDDCVCDEYGNPIETSDMGVNTDSSLLFYRSPGIRGRPRWNYWGSDPSPELGNLGGQMAGGAKTAGHGPFRETALQAPLEVRDQREPPYDVEWASSAFKYVDTFAKHDYSNSVEECLSPQKVQPKVHAGTRMRSYTVASRPIASMTPEEREEARRANRRRRIMKREAEWQERLVEGDRMKELMQDGHRERILSQLERERQKQIQEQKDIYRAREAKKKISAELRERIEKQQQEELEKEDRRINALKMRRERREQIQAQRDKQIEENMARREQIRKQNNQSRLTAWTEKLDEQDAKEAATAKQHQQAKLQRLQHFRQLEKQGQERKDLRIAVNENSQAIFRSHILI